MGSCFKFQDFLHQSDQPRGRIRRNGIVPGEAVFSPAQVRVRPSLPMQRPGFEGLLERKVPEGREDVFQDCVPG